MLVPLLKAFLLAVAGQVTLTVVQFDSEIEMGEMLALRVAVVVAGHVI